MAKPLVFEVNGDLVGFEMTKVDRSKLYGYKEIEAFDEQGTRCDMATLAEDGHTLVGKGGTGMGYLSADGHWCEKTELRPVDLNGNELRPVGSSFSAPITLGGPTTIDDYLSHTVRGLYLMTASAAHPLIGRVQGGEIFKFPYSFRGGLEADTGFLLSNENGEVFMAVGSPSALDFVGLQQVAGTVQDDAATDTDEGDELDFGMI